MGPLPLAPCCLTCKGVRLWKEEATWDASGASAVPLRAARRCREGGKLGRGLSWFPPPAGWPHRACGQPSEVDDVFGLRITQNFCPGPF